MRAYFDVGNVVITGYPQDWIRTLGKRIVKLHIKDFKFAKRAGGVRAAARRRDRLAGSVQGAGRDRLQGTATVELPAGDEAYLREVSRRFDLILSGA